MAINKSTKRNTPYIWIGSAVLLLLVFYAVRLATRTSVPVRAAEAEIGNLRNTTATNGKVEPQVNYEAHAPFPGIVKALYVHEGDKVPRGKLLLVMDDTDAQSRLATALANLRGAQASYDATSKGGTQEERLTLSSDMTTAEMNRDQAQRDLAALTKLQATGAASANEVASAKQRLQSAENSIASLNQRKSSRYDSAELAHAKATLDDAKVAYQAALTTIDQANVRAPFAGTVYSLPASPTEYVQQGDKLLQLADLTKMQVRAYFDEPEIGKLKVGLPITIAWDAQPGKIWHGHISRVPATIIGYGTRNVGEVLVAIDDADGSLLPNTNVTVTVTISNQQGILNIPREALHMEQGKPYVYRIEDDVLRRVPVTTGSINLTQVQILSGLKQGDIVSLNSTNGQPISDGMAVTVVK
ncbi:efflux RND transporter periplasmic adaptor subunit [Acidipila rosea]|nr:efflux RND transporter periplasmic adaptor subunit [Acidipila rosea]